MSSTQADIVRKSFRDIVRQHSGMVPPDSMLETTLIRDGSYCGRRFSLLGYSLVWFIDEQQIKLYDRDGSLLRSVGTREFCETPAAVPTDGNLRRAA